MKYLPLLLLVWGLALADHVWITPEQKKLDKQNGCIRLYGINDIVTVSYDPDYYYIDRIDTVNICCEKPAGYNFTTNEVFYRLKDGTIVNYEDNGSINTTWLPKIPVYLTPDELDKLMELLNKE